MTFNILLRETNERACLSISRRAMTFARTPARECDEVDLLEQNNGTQTDKERD